MKRSAIVTGGNRGIGLEITRMLVKRGYIVHVIARSFDSFPYKDSSEVLQHTFNLEKVNKIPELINTIGIVDVLINNAGIMNTYTYKNYPDEKKKEMLRINLEAPVELIKQVSAGMIAKGGGRVVNVASIAGQIGHPDIWYGISKAGLINATKSYAKSLGPEGILVNAVAPGPVKTDMLNTIPDMRKEQFLKNVITGRFAEADEIAGTVVWLATESPGYINGVCIDLNNGAFLR